MPVTFVIGRGGSGKTERCFSQIVDALRADPLGGPIYWLLPRQATFTTERRLTCASGLSGFCRARVLSFEQLGTEIFDECGGSAVPQITVIGRQMILGHLLRAHAAELSFFKSVERQAGLAAELDRTFDEFERSGKTVADLSVVLDELSVPGAVGVEGLALAGKLHDLRLLYNAYLNFLGQDRLDQHRRLRQIIAAVERCSFVPRATFFVDGFLEFTDHERQMLAAIARAGACMEITLLMDPLSPVVAAPESTPDAMSLFHRTETTYRRLMAAFAEAGVRVGAPVSLAENKRSKSPDLSRLEREFVSPAGRAAERSETASPNDAPAIGRIEAPDRISEVDAVVRSVRGLLSQGYRLRDIAVLVRDLDQYYPPIGKSFGEHGIPYYFIDRRRRASHHPLLHLLRGALEISRFNWKHDAVMSLVKTGLAGISLDEADELENYVLLHRVRGVQWESPEPWGWRKAPRGDGDAESAQEEDLARVDGLRRRIAAALAPLVALLRTGEPVKVSLIASAIFTTFDALGVRETMSRWMSEPAGSASAAKLEEAEEHQQVWTKLTELFEQMVELLGPIEVTPTDFVDIVESGLEGFDLAITPPAPDQVLVGQVDRTRCPPVKAVFVLGLSEGEFPATPRETTVLSDRERRELSRRRLELDPDCNRRLLDERLLGYIAFTQPSERLILSRSVSDDANRPVAPSVFWNRVGELFPGVHTDAIARAQTGDIDRIATPRQFVSGLMRWVRDGQLSASISGAQAPTTTESQDAWPALYQWFVTDGAGNPAIGDLKKLAWPALKYSNQASLKSGVGEPLFTSPLSLNVVQVETIAACSFKHFVRFGLKLAGRERADVGGGDLGQVYHRVLEKLFSQAIRSNGDGGKEFPAISPDAIHAAAAQVAKSLRGELMLSTARNRYLLQRIEKTLEEVIAAQRAMMNRSRYRPGGAGVAFGDDAAIEPLQIQTPAGAQASVHGRIDRVDHLSGSANAIVIDYKLRGETLSLQHAYHGLSLTLLADLLALQAGGRNEKGEPLTPIAAFYVEMLRSLDDVAHPEEAPDPADEAYHLRIKPRGIFESSALGDIDTGCGNGRSSVVAAYRSRDGSFGYRNSTDVAGPAEFAALLDHARRRIGELADRILGGDIGISPYRLARQSPCPACEYRGVCRFETTINRYRHLTPMNREQIFDKVREGGSDAN
ncbi:MAG TPA: PD-(D/E)XK nuclease family protein [Tepidisphaeraceae bacterium]|jgi:ATP-dependent helicase/nuclease subunit B|nr:PD-(D/E)XK nuclease family protein [Tepidisphaeraceae bacterium]